MTRNLHLPRHLPRLAALELKLQAETTNLRQPARSMIFALCALIIPDLPCSCPVHAA